MIGYIQSADGTRVALGYATCGRAVSAGCRRSCVATTGSMGVDERRSIEAEPRSQPAPIIDVTRVWSNNAGVDVVVEPVASATDEMITLGEAAQRAGVTRSTVLRWIRDGYVPAVTSPEGWMIDPTHIDAALAADDARYEMPGPVLVPQVETAIDDAVQASSSALTALSERPAARTTPLAEAVIAPVVDLVREQIDVVHDQAETIGWLQSEVRAAREQIAELADKADPISEMAPEEDAVEHLPSTFRAGPAPTTNADLPIFDFGVVASDADSDEDARAQVMIQETESKLEAMWRQHEAQSIDPMPRITAAPVPSVTRPWHARFIAPLKRRTVE